MRAMVLDHCMVAQSWPRFSILCNVEDILIYSMDRIKAHEGK